VGGPTGQDQTTLPDVELLVCTTCKRGEPVDPETPRPGAVLYQELTARDLPPGVQLRAVECLSNCKRGCSIVLRGEGRWTYVYGDLDEHRDSDIVLEGAARYQSTRDGLVPWRERPEHFRKNCIARIPPLEMVSD
jgi:predicted metal-binding protein